MIQDNKSYLHRLRINKLKFRNEQIPSLNSRGISQPSSKLAERRNDRILKGGEELTITIKEEVSCCFGWLLFYSILSPERERGVTTLHLTSDDCCCCFIFFFLFFDSTASLPALCYFYNHQLFYLTSHSTTVQHTAIGILPIYKFIFLFISLVFSFFI